MPNTQPQPLTTKLLDQLAEYTPLQMPSEIEIMRYKRDAQNLRKVEPSDGWMVEAVICALLGNYEGTKAAFEKSLRSGPGQLEVVVVNYSVSLRRLGRLEESIEVLERYVSDDNAMLLKQAYVTSLNLGYFNEAGRYQIKLEAFLDSKHLTRGPLYNLKAFCDELNISESECAAIFAVVHSEMLDAKSPPSGTELARNHENNNSLMLLFYVDTDADTLANIGLAIIGRLVELNIAAVAEQKVFPLVLKGTP